MGCAGNHRLARFLPPAGLAVMKEITIAGGGLAGLCLGLALRQRDIPTTLHEAGSYPRHRVCGEFISGVSPAVLEALGLNGIFRSAVTERSTAWWLGPRRIYTGELPEAAQGISRYELDDALRVRFQELGGRLQTQSRLAPEAREGTVWCAGRIPAQSPWLGLKCHVRGLALKADLEMHLASNGYVGLARVGEDLVNVCGLFRQARALRGQALLLAYLEAGGLSELAERLRGAEIDEDSLAAVAGFRLGPQSGPPDRLALGDAWSMIPPFTGNGMSMAIESAVLAADPVERYASGRGTWKEAIREVSGALHHRFAARLFYARLMHPFLTRQPGQACLAALARTRLLPFQLCFHALR